MDANTSYVNHPRVPVATQPTAQVVYQQPTAMTKPGYHNWHDGLFSCCNNVGNCILTCLFYPCMLCHMHREYDEFCCTPCFVPCSEVMLSVKHRSRHGIEGAIAGDCCAHTICGPCALCRLYRDMEYVREEKGSLA